MKTLSLLRKICVIVMAIVFTQKSYGQFVVSDPGANAQRAFQYIENMNRTLKDLGISTDQLSKMQDIYNQGKENYEKMAKAKAGIEKCYEVAQSGMIIKNLINKIGHKVEALKSNEYNRCFSPSEIMAIGNQYNNIAKLAYSKTKDLKQLVGSDAVDMSNGERLSLLKGILKDLEGIDASLDRYTEKVNRIAIKRKKPEAEYNLIKRLSPGSSFFAGVE